MKTELLIQLDGLAKKDSDRIFLLAASNLPWELDQALLRRLEKRVQVPLPNEESRLEMLDRLLSKSISSKVSLADFARATSGYSGSDLTLVAKEALFVGLRKKIKEIEERNAKKKHKIDTVVDKLEIEEIDLKEALGRTKPSSTYEEDKYTQWGLKFGSG